jgi:hypothetical protein
MKESKALAARLLRRPVRRVMERKKTRKVNIVPDSIWLVRRLSLRLLRRVLRKA